MARSHLEQRTVFLVPADNYDEAKSAHEDGLEWSRSTAWGRAADALHTISAGGLVPGWASR